MAQDIQSNTPVGAVEELSGHATVTRADGTQEELTIGSPIYQGDVVETTAGGAVNVVFTDDSSFAISEDARLTIDEFIFNDTSESGSSDFSLLHGIFVYTSGLIGRNDPDSVEIDTPVGSIGIRGTTIAGEINPNGPSTITVTEGAIVVRNGAGETTLSQQFETLQLSGYNDPAQAMGVSDAQTMGETFNVLRTVAPDFFTGLDEGADGEGDPEAAGDTGEGTGERTGPDAEQAGQDGEGEPMPEGEGEGEAQAENAVFMDPAFGEDAGFEEATGLEPEGPLLDGPLLDGPRLMTAPLPPPPSGIEPPPENTAPPPLPEFGMTVGSIGDWHIDAFTHPIDPGGEYMPGAGLAVAKINITPGYDLNTIYHSTSPILGLSAVESFYVHHIDATHGILFLKPEALDRLNDTTDQLDFTITAGPNSSNTVSQHVTIIVDNNIDETINATEDNHIVRGYLGDDTLYSDGYIDTELFGGAGHDTLWLDDSKATGYGGTGNDTFDINYTAGGMGDRGEGYGEIGDDTFFLDGLYAYGSGGEGNDTFTMNAGSSHAEGGIGDDAFYMNSSANASFAFGNTGDDSFDIDIASANAFGGTGNDDFAVTAFVGGGDVLQIDGGIGIDFLQIDNNVNFTGVADIHAIEQINIASSKTLTLDLDDVTTLLSESDLVIGGIQTLKIEGDGNLDIKGTMPGFLTSGSTDFGVTIDGTGAWEGYDLYNIGGYQLIVEDGVTAGVSV